jgi:hypothetical protein
MGGKEWFASLTFHDSTKLVETIAYVQSSGDIILVKQPKLHIWLFGDDMYVAVNRLIASNNS